jgi:hypothetical protein
VSRDMLFISHANPEDNDFTRWLALQLAKDGYGVWCDLTKLLGGENFWKDAEDAIRTRTIKFIYVLSRTSNEKDGPRNELQIAKNVLRKDKALHDFIVPLHVDDLPHGEINVLLTSINAVPFERSWAKGYSQLLEVLERDKVPKNPNFNPGAVLLWWRSQFSAERGVKREPETYLSNFLRLTSTPSSLWLHTLVRTIPPGPVQPGNRLTHVGFMDGIDLVTFASANDIRPALGESVSVIESNSFLVSDLILGKTQLDARKGRYFLSRLLRECWERWIGASTLGVYALSNRANCYFFKKEAQPNVDIHFTNSEGKKTYRGVVGYATQADGSRRYWHFAVQSRPVLAPSVGYLISSHVIFTSDGVTPWSSHSKMHSARRRQCKSWFNPEWRDRLLATLHWLSQGNPTISIPVGSEVSFEVSAAPDEFESDISYVDPPTRKQRLLLSVSDQGETTSTEEEEFGEDDGEDDDDEREEQP